MLSTRERIDGLCAVAPNHAIALRLAHRDAPLSDALCGLAHQWFSGRVRQTFARRGAAANQAATPKQIADAQARTALAAFQRARKAAQSAGG